MLVENDKENLENKNHEAENQIETDVNSIDLDSFLKVDDFNNRIIYINSEINDDVLIHVTDSILRYNRYDSIEHVKVENRTPIIIYINSIGGDKFAGLGIIDAIIQSETPVYTVNIGSCFSMAALIFVAGEKRFTFKHSTFLLHDGEISVNTTAKKARNVAKFLCDDMSDFDMDFLIDRTNIDKKTFNKKYDSEWYFFGDEAKSIGVATNIVGVDCKMADIV